MGLDDLELNELAATAGVTPRTIRYYVTQGLLPSPGTRGPGTKWDRALLERLQYIKELQQHHLPLAEIRNRLEALDEEGIRRALGKPPELPLSESALTYVRSVIGEPRVTKGRKAGMTRESRSPDLFNPAPPKWELRRSTWERIRLTPDVELSVRRPLTREQNKMVERLLDAARTIFTEEP